MSTVPDVRTPYERRVDLVTEVVTTYSPLPKAAADELAVLILHALDHIPEKVR
ncbi:hypothetical protein PSU4_18940 [Pseudonocardia sulfidoxydans NBRC 16205]|jgi:hypothetical protein|uniref:Uncharacterized protein n=1 Tax=Pseudonocardia sulfidoxydans NBRC 16205 TaxID=1223511 RepID=A0A511DDR4_9PSEU|nr:DUF6307 family protein [Pseudonocardia sulfidoxydans]GEL22940.1 hypothetical protein PSU4_18940 [Pseudonocardia sulfidoxydans NBRC 16205]